MRSYPIKPLALHERVHDFDFAKPVNTLTVTGQFTIGEAHEWLTSCVSQIPDRCPVNDEASFMLRSTENGGTILHATYRDDRAVYKSDSISTIVIMRDMISRLTTARKLRVHMSLDINQESVEHTLKLIHPKMEYFAGLIKQAELAKGLRELESSFEDLSFLSPDLQSILRRHDELLREVAMKKTHFDRILGVITDLYVDKWKLQGINPKHKTTDLLQMLSTDYSFEKVMEFFTTKP
ncbi:hypothetical protein FO519_006652 [Halicephalobus sp. NKZ332]|nr:hypothetical protein FO519_006652 [Halicephalobus sp. NKZ332]